MQARTRKIIVRLAKSFSLEETTLLLLYRVYRRYRVNYGDLATLLKLAHYTLNPRQIRYLIERIHQEENKQTKRQYNQDGKFKS